jgi:transcriptional regulator with XRE-family HTH domain
MMLSNFVLQNLRREAKYSQEYMADLMKIDQGTYNRLENGKIKLRMEHIPKIAKAINKSEDEILNRLKQYRFDESNTSTSCSTTVVSESEKDLLYQILIEKERSIVSKDELIKSQSMTILLLQGEIERLRTR